MELELELLVVAGAESLVEDGLAPAPSPPASGSPGMSVGRPVEDCAFARRKDWVVRSAREMSVRARAGEAKQQRMVETRTGERAYDGGDSVEGSSGAAGDDEDRWRDGGRGLAIHKVAAADQRRATPPAAGIHLRFEPSTG